MRPTMPFQWKLLGGLAAALLSFAAPAQASLTLTAAGISDGFILTRFADIGPTGTGCCSGPFGMAVTNNGNVIVSLGTTSSSSMYVWPNVDGQSAGTALFTQFSNSGTSGFATAGGQAYGWQNGQFVQFNNDGTVNHVLTGVTPGPYLGAWGNPTNGHIVASTSVGLIDINPTAAGGLGTFSVIGSGSQFGDGVSISPDGLTAYFEQGCIVPYTISSGAAGAGICGFNSPDGTGTIIGGAFDGGLIVNNNNGNVDLYFASTITTIATGAFGYTDDRGDYTQPDQRGCLFLTEGSHIDRLCIAGGSIGTEAPEPASLGLLGFGLAAAAMVRRRRKG